MTEFFEKLKFKRMMKRFKKMYELSAKGTCLKIYCGKIMENPEAEYIECYESIVRTVAADMEFDRVQAASLLFYLLDYIGD